jgi:hypothetical protein
VQDIVVDKTRIFVALHVVERSWSKESSLLVVLNVSQMGSISLVFFVARDYREIKKIATDG